MPVINLTQQMDEAEADKLQGKFIDEANFDFLIDNEDCDVYKPNGDLLVKYRAGVLPLKNCSAAWKSLRKASTESHNRGAAGGFFVENQKGSPVLQKMKTYVIKRDGTRSRTNTANIVKSGLVGYMDRYPRMPYCRMTAFNIDHHEEFKRALPFVYDVDAVFKANEPDRYNAQMDFIHRTNSDFYIKNTVFTTITVNKNFRTAVHKDAGDLKQGLGVMSVLEAGKYEGALLVFPAFRVAVNMRTAGVCLADVHEWHGNTPLKGKGKFERITCVFYYREKMIQCGSAEDELNRAKTVTTDFQYGQTRE